MVLGVPTTDDEARLRVVRGPRDPARGRVARAAARPRGAPGVARALPRVAAPAREAREEASPRRAVQARAPAPVAGPNARRVAPPAAVPGPAVGVRVLVALRPNDRKSRTAQRRGSGAGSPAAGPATFATVTTTTAAVVRAAVPAVPGARGPAVPVQLATTSAAAAPVMTAPHETAFAATPGEAAVVAPAGHVRMTATGAGRAVTPPLAHPSGVAAAYATANRAAQPQRGVPVPHEQTARVASPPRHRGTRRAQPNRLLRRIPPPIARPRPGRLPRSNRLPLPLFLPPPRRRKRPGSSRRSATRPIVPSHAGPVAVVPAVALLPGLVAVPRHRTSASRSKTIPSRASRS